MRVAARATAALRLTLTDRPRPADPRDSQAYRLRIDATGAYAEADGEAGLFHALATIGQWLRLHIQLGRGGAPATGEGDRRVPGLRVEDRPAFVCRGVLLDVSRDQVPTLAMLERLIERLADWKINQLQLYMEHTFAYRGHERVWRGASPLTPSQIRRLDAACQAVGIELVPNQNSFGHFHRWLIHEPYRQLAECPDGIEHPFSASREPFSLCATDPRSLNLLDELYGQLLPCFASRQLNVGLDETFDLGQCRSADACRERGKSSVYLDFVRRLRDLAARHGRSIQMWGDIVLEKPEQIEELPADVTVLAWGYEADHPFDDQARRFRASGRPFYLCPGTSSWLSFAGRTHNALHNLARAAIAGEASGAEGYLICDWGDRGHLQPWIASLPGLVAGAEFAWTTARAQSPDSFPLADLLDHHAFDTDRDEPEAELGKLVCRLGNAYRLTGTRSFNGSPLFHLLASAQDDLDHDRYAGMSTETLAATRDSIHAIATDSKRLAPPGDSLARDELGWGAQVLTLACDLGLARLRAGTDRAVGDLPPGDRHPLAERLRDAIDQRRALWRRRNRPGGLHGALAELRTTLRKLDRPA